MIQIAQNRNIFGTFASKFTEMLLLKKSVAVICLIAFLISTIGISVQTHSCLMSGTTKVALLPEIFGNIDPCCQMNSTNESTNFCSVNNVPCCNNTFTYTKIASQYTITIASVNFVKHVLDIPINHSLRVSSIEADHTALFSDYIPPPIELYGTTLLHFIHNIKIALPYSL